MVVKMNMRQKMIGFITICLYDRNTNSITLSGRAVININYDTKQLNWIVGSSSNGLVTWINISLNQVMI